MSAIRALIAILPYLAILIVLFTFSCGYGMGKPLLKKVVNRRTVIAALIIAVSMAALSWYIVGKNQYIYFWDHAGYWKRSYWSMNFLFEHPDAFPLLISDSIFKLDYNYLTTILVVLPMKLIGSSFRKHVLINTVVYLIPVIFIIFFCCVKLLEKNGMLDGGKYNSGAIMLACMILVLTANALYFAQLVGYIDIAALVPAGLSILLLCDYAPEKLDRGQIVRDILIALNLLATFLFRRYFAYFVVGYAAALFLYSVMRIIDTGITFGKAKNAIFNLLIIGAVALAIMLIVFRPLLVRMLTNNYAEAYAAYDDSLANKLGVIVQKFGVWTLLLSVGGVIIPIVRRKNYAVPVFLAVSAIVSAGTFFGVQSMGLHHLYIIALQVYILAVIGVFSFAELLKNAKARKICVSACLVVSVTGTAACFVPAVRRAASPVTWLFSDEYEPLIRNDIDELRGLADYVNSLTAETDKTVYVLSSGYILNNDMFYSMDFPEKDTCAINNLCPTADADLRDGFPESFLSADIVVTTDPVNLHLTEGTQEVVRFLAQEVMDEESCIGRHYEEQSQSFDLDNGTKARIYIKQSSFSQEDLQFLADYFTERYPGHEDMFANVILGN